MKVAFRTDASDRIGTGHVMRCRALAAELRRRGADVQFICREHRGHQIAALRQAGFPTTALARPDHAATPGPDYADWLGVSELQDASDTAAALAAVRPDWLVVDHYGLSEKWERALRPSAGKILAIDDLANRDHDCDALVDQNFSLSPSARYQGRIPPACTALFGPRYALLADGYAGSAWPVRTDFSEVRRILVSFGGVDQADMTGMTVAALSSPEFSQISIDVVLGAAYGHRKKLEAAVIGRPRTVLHDPLPSLADLMAEADLAIGAGGITTWERCRLGLPTLAISIAENQVPASRDLDAIGALRYLGRQEDVNAEILRDAISALRTDATVRQSMSEMGPLLVDGKGTLRVAEFMDPTPADQAMLRAATSNDCAFYYQLANDPDVRRQSFRSDPIEWPAHRTWFEGRLRDPKCRMMVFEARGLPVGQIRFERKISETFLNYALDPVVRNRGWGKLLVALGIRELLKDGPTHIRAEVKKDNLASRKVFEKLGFSRVKTAEDEKLVYETNGLD